MRGIQLFDELFTAVPELVAPVKMLCSEYGGLIDNDVLMWEVGVMECLEFLLSEGYTYQSTLEKVFSFFERMATESSDSKSFLYHTTIAYFYSRSHEQQKAIQLMHSETKSMWTAYVSHQKNIELWRLSLFYSDEEMDELGMHYEYLN